MVPPLGLQPYIIDESAADGCRLSSPLAVATSPSGQARQGKAVGAMPTGKLISVPRTVVLVSLTDTSRSTRGLRRILRVVVGGIHTRCGQPALSLTVHLACVLGQCRTEGAGKVPFIGGMCRSMGEVFFALLLRCGDCGKCCSRRYRL